MLINLCLPNNQLLFFADNKMVYEGPKASETSGRSLRNLQGMFGDVRKRTAPGLFTDIDRVYRDKFLQAHKMTERERAYHFFYLWDNPDFRKARLNVLRRVWQAPGDAFERALRPALGLKNAFMTRWFTGKAFWAMGAVWATSYYFLYNKSDWTRTGGWKAIHSKPPTMPHNPSYPKPDPKWVRGHENDYFNMGFKEGGKDFSPSTPVTW